MDSIANNTATTAELYPGVRFFGEIETVDDSDWLRVNAVLGQNFWFSNHFVSLGYLFNTKWTFRDSTGTEIASFFLNNNDLEFSYESPINGLLYLDISGTSTDPVRGVGTYELTLTDAPDIANDFATTTTIGKTETIESALDRPDDIDVVRLDVVAGETYQINVSPATNELLRLLSPDGTVLDVMRDTFGSEIRVLFEATETGPIFLELSQIQGQADFFQRYALTVSDPTDLVGETVAEAAAASLDTRLDIQIDSRGDRDWFLLDVAEGQTYQITRNFGDPKIAIRTTDGNILNSITSQSPTVAFTASETGQVVVDVGASDIFAGLQGITISETDDLANNASTTAAVSVGTLFTGTAGFDDEDWVALDVVAGQDYAIELTRLASNTRGFVDLSVVDASGAVLTERDLVSGDTALTFSAAETETVFIAFDNRTSATGDYTILVSEVADAVPGSTLTSEQLSLDTPITVTFDRASDTDWYRFDTTPGAIYTVSLENQFAGAGVASAKVFDVDGRELPTEFSVEREGNFSTTFYTFGSAEGGTVLIEARKSDLFTDPGTFTLEIGLDPDDALGSAATFRKIAPNETLFGEGDPSIDPDNIRFSDTDSFRFDTVLGTEYLVIVEAIDVFGNLGSISVDDIDGPALRVQDTNPEGVTALRFTPLEDGEGLISVSSRPGDTYSVRLVDLAADVSGSASTTAQLVPGTTTTETLEFADDQDWFKLETTAGAAYHVSIDPRSSPDTFVSIAISASDGTVLVSEAVSGPTSLQFVPGQGKVFVQVVGGDAALGNTYTLDVTEDLIGQSVTDAGTLNVGDHTFGTIDFDGDQDWFELALEGGEEVAIRVFDDGTGSLSGSTFEVAGPDGSLLDSRLLDTSNPMIVSQSNEGSVFVRVKSDQGTTGGYRIETSVAQEPPFSDLANPLFSGLNSGLLMQGTPTALAAREITYSFADFADVFDPSIDARADLSWNSYETARISAAMEQFEELLDIDFVETEDNSDITFFAARQNGVFSKFAFTSPGELGFAFLPLGGSLDGNIVFNTEGFGWDRNASAGDTFDGGLEQYGFGFQTVLHEVGHALGLDHPFEGGEFSTLYPGITDADNDGVSDDVFGDAGSFGLSQSAFTIMSYVDGWTEHPFGTGNIFLSEQFSGLLSDPGGHIGTPMALDAAALQTVYGANQSTNSGNDVYFLPDTQAQTTGYSLIWDTGGSDTIRYVGARDVVLDLRAATLQVEDGGGGFISFVNEAVLTDPVVGGFAIAHGVIIEAAESGAGDDVLTGNEASNTLIAGAGNDTLSGNAGDNTLTGGTGADLFIIADKTGNDTITDFTAGEDQIDVQALELTFSQLVVTDEIGNSRISYTSASNTGSILLQGVTAASVVESDFIISPTATGTSFTGTTGDDELSGGSFDEQFFGLAGNDTITANAGNDTLFGDTGNDTLRPGAGNDSIEGGENADVLDYSDATGAVSILLSDDDGGSVTSGTDADSFVEIEAFLLTDLNDTFDGSANSVGLSVHGAAGDDDLLGGSGNDTLEGGTGADSIDGSSGADTASYENSAQGVAVRLDTDSATRGDAAGDVLISIENVIGSGQTDTITGDGQSNTLTGLDGNDQLNGGLGADTMDGGLGNDRFFVDDAGDVVIEGVGEGTDLLSTSVDFTLPDNVENGSTLGTGDVAITGNGLANFITGNGGANHLRGLDGGDRLIAGLGDDTLEGGSGNDILQGQGGADRFVVTADNGDDQILDWEATTDVLDFSTLGLRFVDLAITSSGNEALITFDDPAGGSGSIRLAGIDPEALEIGIMADPGGVGSPGGIPLTAGTSGADNLAATNGDDDVVGLAGNDILNGRAGADTMVGGFGNDRYFLDNAGDLAIEQQFQGTDQMDATFSFTLAEHIENGAVLGGGAVDITGNGLANFITGSALSNVLTGLDGRDRLIGFDGDDTLIGGLENDVLEGGAGADVFVFAPEDGLNLITDFEVGVDLIDVTALNVSFADLTIVDGLLGARVIFDLTPGSVDLVTVQGVAAADLRLTSFLGAPNDPIVGTEGNDVLFGTIENDELQGLGGADLVDGRAGADTMLGGLGDDRYFVDDAGDVVTELPGEGTDLVSSFIDFTLPDNVENGSALGAGDVDLTGNGLANALTGNAGANTLSGEDGPDNLQGLAGADLIDGGAGTDVLRGGADADTFLFETGDGTDQIIDFEIDVDTINLSATGLAFGDLSITDTGPNATVTYGTDTITVFNVSAEQISEDQFEFGP